MYFLLGFYKLEEEKIIKVNFKSDIIVNMATKINNDFIDRREFTVLYADKSLAKKWIREWIKLIEEIEPRRIYVE